MTIPSVGPQAAAGAVIVGGSAAAVSTALALRAEGYERSITLISGEPRLPYDRPPLSKGMLNGTLNPASFALLTEQEIVDHRLEVLLGVRAVELSQSSKLLHLSNGSSITYQHLVIATGVAARPHPGVGKLGGVLSLRTLDDAIKLRERLTRGSRLVVIGAGFIGLEAAVAAVGQGALVTIVEADDVPLAGRLPLDVGRWITREHESRGVRFRLGQRVESFESSNDEVVGVTLTDGSRIEADTVLVGIGTTPNTGWLSGSQLVLVNGVECDEYCQAAPGIYAVGDVANAFHPGYGRHLRIEHRSHASEQGVIVAKNVMGKPTQYRSVPSFWTDQYDFKLQLYGLVDSNSVMEFVSGSFATQSWVAIFRAKGEIVAVLGRNAAREMLPYRRQLAQHAASSELSIN